MTTYETFAPFVYSTCPYCGFKNGRYLQIQWHKHDTFIVTCDSEEGGCDQEYVIRVEPSFQVKEFSIEPVEPKPDQE